MKLIDKHMKPVVMWIVISMLGIIMLFIGGYFTGDIMGAMLGFFGGFIMLIPIIQVLSTARQRRFLPLFANIDPEKEKFIHFPDKYGRLGTLIVSTEHEGVCHKDKKGFFSDKGTEYVWGNCPCSFAEPFIGTTIDIKNSQYMNLLEKDNNILGYEDAVRNYLTDDDYKTFNKNFRTNIRPDKYDIEKEIKFLMDAKPRDTLSKTVFGETWGFPNLLTWLKYIFHPLQLEVAINSEKLWARQEALGYKDPARAMGYAKAIVYILFGLMIFLIVMGSGIIDLSSLFSMG